MLDNASNPSQAVQNVQKFISDPKYVAILGSGNAGAAVATAPLATEGRIPFLALSPPTPLVAPAVRPYVYVALPTARLYAYSMAQYLKSLGVTRIALMGDNGGFGRDGVGQVQALAKAFGFTITDDVIFAPTSTSFTAELTKVRNSNAQALWIWTVTPAASTIVKEFRQLRLSQRLVLTGGNIDTHLLANVLLRDLARSGRMTRLRIELQDRPGALNHVMALFARHQVNIIEVYHQRIYTHLPAKDAAIEVECEARDVAQIERLTEALRADGLVVRPVALD